MIPVHVVLSDRNWILERLAVELGKRLEYVTYSMNPEPRAGIQYYVTYSTYRGRVSKQEMALFTHYEEFAASAAVKFKEVAHAVEHCVCISPRYADMLHGWGIEQATVISPGIDLERFTPKIHIGVVGRTYKTGRKGEALVAQVMDIPEIVWHFTGEGWPGPSEFVSDEQLPDFYNRLDYLLVPSFYEGGPMPVLEALACGRPVIAPPVGWTPDFPHIEYETGNASDLRRVLTEIIAERMRLRVTVLGRTWEAWAKEHDRLFRSLAASMEP